ncbi:MAG TPA: carboxypeptidase regulatory-like domain-containing protein [Armatimonadetes bacterium]|nr:carboxypeptidase regulatory-like domain-containing protein [Armatimonadota bacterium]
MKRWVLWGVMLALGGGMLGGGCGTVGEEDIGPTGSLSGRVVDNAGWPMAEAIVTVRGTALSTTSDQEGRFSFEALPPGNYVLAATVLQPTNTLSGESPVRVAADQSTEVLIVVQPGLPPAGGEISGFVVDLNGELVIGAEVQLHGLVPEGVPTTTHTGVQGGFSFQNVPPGEYELVATVVGVEGQQLRGVRTGVRVGSRTEERLAQNAHIVVAPLNQTGQIIGRVTDEELLPLPGAKVVAELLLPDRNMAIVHLVTYTDTTGYFALGEVPSPWRGVRLIASAPGFANEIRTVNVLIGDTVEVAFQLVSSFNARPEAPTNVEAIALTYPHGVTRSRNWREPYLSLRRGLYLRRGGIRGRRWAQGLDLLGEQFSPQPLLSRRPPEGSLIEVDVFWDPVDAEDVTGYWLYRSLFPGHGYLRVAKVTSPFAFIGADLSFDLSVQTRFYYRVTAYNSHPFESERSEVVSVVPLLPFDILSPADGAEEVSATPLLRWEPVEGAAAYTVNIFDRFPSTGLTPVWESDLIRPPDTRVVAPRLAKGWTYYWVVIADNAVDFRDLTAESFTSIARFTVEE